MGKQRDTHKHLMATLVGSLAILAVGGIGTTADAATMGFSMQKVSSSGIDRLTEDGPAGSLPLPGGFAIDNGGEEPPPPDYRAHSDVPDLPDDIDPQAASAGTSHAAHQELPRLSDTFGTGFTDVLVRPQGTLPLDGSATEVVPGLSTVPSPGALVLFGAAGLGMAGRRRRR